MFRQLRILFLLLVLLGVALDTWLTKMRSTDWDQPLRVVLYPINGDGSAQSATYIQALTRERFKAIADYMAEERKAFNLSLEQPVDVDLSTPMTELPPTPPRDRDSIPAVMWWSLKMRFWAYFKHNYAGPRPNIKIFVLYHDPNTHPRLAHSLGLEKGLVGVVNAYAERSYDGSNRVVITHELLHTLGATDKYDPGNGQPVFPEGYVDPDKKPVFPQTLAEIMAGKIPVSKATSRMPKGLDETIIGRITAREINWIRPR